MLIQSLNLPEPDRSKFGVPRGLQVALLATASSSSVTENQTKLLIIGKQKLRRVNILISLQLVMFVCVVFGLISCCPVGMDPLCNTLTTTTQTRTETNKVSIVHLWGPPCTTTAVEM